MEMIVIAGLAMSALLLFRQRKGSAQRLERVRSLRNARSTYGQTDVPEDRC